MTVPAKPLTQSRKRAKVEVGVSEERAEYDAGPESRPDVANEIGRLFEQLSPELRKLLRGRDPFRIEIHGKPGTKCRVSVTRFVE